MHALLHSVPWPCSRPPPTHASAGDSCALAGKSGSVSCWSLFLSPGSWCAQGFVCALQESVSPVLSMFWHTFESPYCTAEINTTPNQRYFNKLFLKVPSLIIQLLRAGAPEWRTEALVLPAGGVGDRLAGAWRCWWFLLKVLHCH